LNKKSLLNKVNVKSPFDGDKSEKLLELLLEEIRYAVLDGSSFEIEGFGKFTKEHREMKTLLYPRKKAEILVPPKDKIIFTPSDEMLKRINNG